MHWWHEIDFGTLPAWLGAGGVFVAYRALRSTNRRGEREQASKVHLVVVLAKPDFTNNHVAIQASIENRSDGPIYMGVVRLINEDRRSRVTTHYGTGLPVVMPGDHTSVDCSVDLKSTEVGIRTVMVEFHDADGIQWARLENGQLLKLRWESYVEVLSSPLRWARWLFWRRWISNVPFRPYEISWY